MCRRQLLLVDEKSKAEILDFDNEGKCIINILIADRHSALRGLCVVLYIAFPFNTGRTVEAVQAELKEDLDKGQYTLEVLEDYQSPYPILGDPEPAQEIGE